MNQKQKIKKVIIYFPVLLFISYLLFFSQVRGQTPETGVTLTWSTNTYVPLDYSGKALPTRGSIIEVVANIDSKEVNPQELNYRWFLNTHLQEGQSGQGKPVLKFPVGWTSPNNQSVRVEIRDKIENLFGSAHRDIKIVEPEIVLRPMTQTAQGIKKEILPLEASVSSIIKKYQIRAEQEINFMAQPYFFNIQDINELIYQWRLAGKKAIPENSTQPNVLLLKIGRINKSIKQNLNILTENKRNLLERAEATAEINIIP